MLAHSDFRTSSIESAVATPDAPPERKRDYTRLTRAEDALILKLHDEGLNQPQIAQRLGCHVSSVSRCLAEFGDTRALAKHRANQAALKLMDRVIAEADVDQSLEVLDRIGVVEKRREERSGQGVNVFIGMPSHPIGPDPLIVVSAPRLSPAVTDDFHSVTGVPEKPSV